MASNNAIASIRSFNRFYTRLLGTLNEHLLEGPLSLAEARVLYELAHRFQPTASDIAVDLGLDLSYLSRILQGFTRAKLIRRQPSKTDRRQSTIALTPTGQRLFESLDRRSSDQVHQMLAPLTFEQQTNLVTSMTTIESLLDGNATKSTTVILRQHRPGDMGWVIERHGALYAQEYGWDERFEALVARIAADFIDKLDHARERCWIAESDGRNVGSVFLVRESEDVAKLRLLLVDPSARGFGLGRRLVAECVDFARQAGYRRLTLWTQQNLEAARRIYAQAGFTLTRSEPYTGIGRDLISEYWDLDLVPACALS